MGSFRVNSDRGLRAIDTEFLTGKWKLFKNLLDIWSRPYEGHSIIVRSQQAFSTFEAVYVYKKENDPTFALRKYKNPIIEYLKKIGYLYNPDPHARLSDFILSYSDPKNRYKFEETSEELIECSLPGGLKYYMTSFHQDDGSNITGAGPYLRSESDYSEFKKRFADSVWEKEGNDGLQLIMDERSKYEAQVQLSKLDKQDAYVSIPSEDSPWTHLASLTTRCQAFLNAKLSRKILFHGPPGTGKTSLARQLSCNLGGRTLRIDPEALNYCGIDYISDFVSHLNPGVVLFDDLDRNPGVKKLLHYMEDKKFNNIIIGTVNTVKTLDPALLRPGRFDEVLYVGEPNKNSRKEIINHYCSLYNVVLDEENLVNLTRGFSPADIKEVLKCLSVVGETHLNAEIQRVTIQRELYKGDKCAEYLLKESGLLNSDPDIDFLPEDLCEDKKSAPQPQRYVSSGSTGRS